ncbi:transposase [Streptomyces sp. NPDC059070]|uniref:transposase n=1 Tax=unclassified Streptomyces TaxID=2593676 RepID=UPI0034E2AB50
MRPGWMICGVRWPSGAGFVSLRPDYWDRSAHVMTRPWIVSDHLRALIEPLLPPWPTRSPGPKPVDDRLCLQGIRYVLHQGMARQLLPPELGFGSGQTCWGA